MDQRSRFVFASNLPLEESIRWAVEHGFTRVDFNADIPVNYPDTFVPERVAAIRGLLAGHGVSLGIHTLSAINMAEMSPVLHSAIDEYLRQNFDLAVALGAGYVICHGGYHFGGDYEARLATAIDRMRRAATWAEERGIDIYFENHNKEPDESEMHYMPRDVTETRRFFAAVRSPRFKWAFNVPHETQSRRAGRRRRARGPRSAGRSGGAAPRSESARPGRPTRAARPGGPRPPSRRRPPRRARAGRSQPRPRARGRSYARSSR
jgi:sugar phosphate isomerase/epimerase